MIVLDALIKSGTCVTIAEVRKLIHAGAVKQGNKVFTATWEEIRPLEIESIFVGKREITHIKS